MPNCERVVFENITVETWNQLTNRVKNNFGVEIKDYSAQGSKYGYTVYWDYNPAAGTLSVQCVEKPASIECSAINRDIANFIRSSLVGR
jgi:hypothetical protein